MSAERLREREDGSLTPLSHKERRDLYKLISLRPGRPERLADVLWFVWGADIFLWELPLFKLMLALDVLIVWWLA